MSQGQKACTGIAEAALIYIRNAQNPGEVDLAKKMLGLATHLFPEEKEELLEAIESKYDEFSRHQSLSKRSIEHVIKGKPEAPRDAANDRAASAVAS